MSIDHNMDVQYQRYTLQTKTAKLGINPSKATMLRDVVVGRRRPQSMPLAMFTMRKELHGFLFLYMHAIQFLLLWGSVWRPFGPLELRYKSASSTHQRRMSLTLSRAHSSSEKSTAAISNQLQVSKISIWLRVLPVKKPRPSLP